MPRPAPSDWRPARPFLTHLAPCPSPPAAGDYGFDPLRLGTNPDQLKWFREAELTNGRWAMAAVAGILFTDLVGLTPFWEAGAKVRSVQYAALRLCALCAAGMVRWPGWHGISSVGSG